MAKNNAWSNIRLYNACSQLPHEDLCAKRTSFFPSIFLTLQHIWIVDEYYIDGLTNTGRGASIWADETKHNDIHSLYHAQRNADDRLVAFCESPNVESSFSTSVSLERRSGFIIEKVADVLLHVFTHQTHHRGQVHAMLSGTTIAPPQLDEYYLSNDRPIAEAERLTANKTALLSKTPQMTRLP